MSAFTVKQFDEALKKRPVCMAGWIPAILPVE